MTCLDPPAAQLPATLSADAGEVAAYARKYHAEWIECPDCGLFQALPPRRGKFDRACIRCRSSFGCGHIEVNVLLALSAAMTMILVAINMSPEIGVYIEGRHNAITIADASSALFKQRMPVLGLFVLALTVLMPLAHLTSQSAVLFCLWRGKRPSWLARANLWSGRAAPWAMLDVYLLGIFITISKLRDMAQIRLLPGLWALGVFVGLLFVFLACLDRQRVWDMILPPPVPGPGARHKHWIGCHSCNYLHEIRPGEDVEAVRCDRCGTGLRPRKPDSIQRTWALVLAGYLLYIPANIFPVMTVIALGREQPTTIMEGVRHLWTAKDWPYAILVFAASIVIPLFKLLGLTAFLLTYHLRQARYLVHCTKLYRVFDKIGRWSALDIFVAAALGALVDFDNLAAITPGPGILPFACVVVATMLAVSGFDPRLMWDAAAGGKDD